MALPKKKGMGILAMMGGSPDEDGSDPMAEKERVAGDIISAIARKDRRGLAEASTEMYELCAAHGAEGSDEYEDEDAALEEA